MKQAWFSLVLLGVSLTPCMAETRASLGAVQIPRLERAPTLEDFLGMSPPADLAGQMAHAQGFIQREPSDGQPASVETQVYFGYDDKQVYFIFLAFDERPESVRARMTRRENTWDDDVVAVTLDTFDDQRRAYYFRTNPFGIQSDAIFTEGQGFDFSFNTLWHSEGKLTEHGFVVWMAIPFHSLRFPSQEVQTWGLLFSREKPERNERAFWPHVSSRVEGRLQQAVPMRGLKSISPGRNLQLIPFGVFRSFRAIDDEAPGGPEFFSKSAEADAGLDAKMVFQDSLVLDLAFNPDFSQVESDQPQVTTNRRFEVFFPERRPFFLENAQFFNTPINLVFTRRIADPRLGARLTGKWGKNAIGALLIDDEAPGKRVSVDDPLAGSRARFGIFRLSRDIFSQSSIGLIFTDRQHEGRFNRVGGLDGRFRLNDNWTTEFQAVTSQTRLLDGTELAGPAYQFGLERQGRQFEYDLNYRDISPGFVTQTGFVSRNDIRRLRQEAEYRWRPEGEFLISFGPSFEVIHAWDHSGTRLDAEVEPRFQFSFIGDTFLGFFYTTGRERLRPDDFSSLTQDRDYSFNRRGFWFGTSYWSKLSLRAMLRLGSEVNFVPPVGRQPETASLTSGDLNLTWRPTTSLRIDHNYIYSGLRDRASGGAVFNNHILRSNWNWQFNRELSARVILQYDTLLANPSLSSLETSKNFNADFLVTYQVNPWTVLFAGYNSNHQNLDLIEQLSGNRLDRTGSRFLNDARQFFVKFSYLLRF